jgi:hypothetical protein
MLKQREVFLLALVISLAMAVGVMALHLPPPITEEQYAAAQKAAKEAACSYSPLRCFWNWTTHDPVAFFTSVLAVFTGILGVSTIGLWVQTRKAADAAQAAADYIPNVERARLYILVAGSIDPEIKRAAGYDHPNSGDMNLGAMSIAYKFKNFGKTPAFIREIGHRIVLAENNPQVVDYISQVPITVAHVLGEGDETDGIKADFPPMKVRDAVAIRDAAQTIWLKGYVVFDDAFGKRWEQRFIWHYSALTEGRFRVYGYQENSAQDIGLVAHRPVSPAVGVFVTAARLLGQNGVLRQSPLAGRG